MINVLLIDDDEDEYLIFSDAIQAFTEQMRCIHAKDADQSFRILQNMRPDIIFVDMNMPRMNGIDCIRNIKGMHKKDAPLIVLYSTYIDPELAKKAKEAGASECLQKPASIDALIDSLYPFLNMLLLKY